MFFIKVRYILYYPYEKIICPAATTLLSILAFLIPHVSSGRTLVCSVLASIQAVQLKAFVYRNLVDVENKLVFIFYKQYKGGKQFYNLSVLVMEQV
jgi:hypothetical protein